MKWLVGVDEVGRGPLAGPVMVGAAAVPLDFDWRLLPGVTDSKQLTEAKRAEIFALARKLQKAGELNYAIASVGALQIDRNGIVPSIRIAMKRALATLALNPADCMVKLDGSLLAPIEYLHQETIIKGDLFEPVIGLASIMAKVTRDRYMVRKSAEPIFAPYHFHLHKGYGTRTHRAAIAEFGLSPLHRATYCQNIKVL